MADDTRTSRQYRVDGTVTEVARAVPLMLAESHRYHLHRLDDGNGATWELRRDDATVPLARIEVTPASDETSALTVTPVSLPAPAFTSFDQALRKALMRYGFEVQEANSVAPVEDEEEPEMTAPPERDVAPSGDEEDDASPDESAPDEATASPGDAEERLSLPRPRNRQVAGPLSEHFQTVRRRIYRQRALDPQATPESRLHAAQVLVASDDTETAARVFAALIRHRTAPAEVAKAAFDALTDLGQDGLPGFWALDAEETDPQRLVAVAAHLAALGDTETARLRLEGLARTGDPAVRRDAITTLIDRDLLPRGQIVALMRSSSVALPLRLAAAQHLVRQSETQSVAFGVLTTLAQSDAGDVAREAVDTLVGAEGYDVGRTLGPIATEAPHPTVRLTAARALLDAGETNVARRALRDLAASDAEAVARTAFDLLQRIETTADRDAEHLARHATLPAIQYRAARFLAVPENPEVVQQLAAETFLRLNRTDEALPILVHLLLRSTNDSRLQRWVLAQFGELGPDGEEALLDALHAADDPTESAMLAEAILETASQPAVRRQVAAWLLSHQQPRWAIDVLEALACNAQVSNDEARAATLMLNQTFYHAARATVAALERIVQTSPHSGARSEARQILLRRQPGALSLEFLIDALIIEEQIPDTLEPALDELRRVAPEAAQAITARVLDPSTNTQQRWRLFNLLVQLPDDAATDALKQVVSRAPTAAIALTGAERLFEYGEPDAAIAVLADLATSAPNPHVRERAVNRLRDRPVVLRSIAQRTPHADTRAQARSFLPKSAPASFLEQAWFALEEWVERLGLVERDR